MRYIRTWVALIITALWALSYVASVTTGDFSGFQLSTPVMLIAAAWLLGADMRRRNGD